MRCMRAALKCRWSLCQAGEMLACVQVATDSSPRLSHVPAGSLPAAGCVQSASNCCVADEVMRSAQHVQLHQQRLPSGCISWHQVRLATGIIGQGMHAVRATACSCDPSRHHLMWNARSRGMPARVSLVTVGAGSGRSPSLGLGRGCLGLGSGRGGSTTFGLGSGAGS